jgi:hypothetical protein
MFDAATGVTAGNPLTANAAFLISIKEQSSIFTYYCSVGSSWRYPMTTLSNFQTSRDAGQEEAWNQTTFTLGVLTAIAIVAILFFASTS